MDISPLKTNKLNLDPIKVPTNFKGRFNNGHKALNESVKLKCPPNCDCVQISKK